LYDAIVPGKIWQAFELPQGWPKKVGQKIYEKTAKYCWRIPKGTPSLAN
jgi:Fe-S cluster biosynthesis and repair protein YggX